MITINISDDQLQKAFDASIEKMMGDTYSNPVKQVIDSILGYSSKSPLKEEMNQQIAESISNMLKSDKFVTIVGEAFAKEIARREADRLASLNNRR